MDPETTNPTKTNSKTTDPHYIPDPTSIDLKRLGPKTREETTTNPMTTDPTTTDPMTMDPMNA